MLTRGIREYVARDRQAVRASKDAYWARRIAERGPVEAFRVAEALRRQALLQHPGWPDEALRREDLQFHVRVAERLRRAGAPRGR
jgi:hypothetical protein